MKIFTLMTLFISSISFAGEYLECKINQRATNALIESKLKKHPEARGQGGDNGAIVQTSMKSINFKINKDATVSGSFKFYYNDEDGTKIDFQTGSRDLGKQFDGQLSVGDVVSIKKLGLKKFNIDIDGWDHYNYVLFYNPSIKRLTIRESFDFDCGGSGSMAYGIMSCK